ncbi:MAG TPA: roadblock/LC7 domain-containing protein [Candidatus Thiothrix moscowensis]|uniref:roadblock/LC7 domain-containing protein n=1 Tax=unclassified Thiothrix TaxID=2636184 RepID=UPI0025D3751F|nr:MULTISPECIES: roadblock/LC7 domain-containing protein [unclassified Thiothrix]HRJ53832.1 roadblock/LC7 domain-containing protein [Candidatus Thiothrix moscowensis]HRJ93914.1 roadblock/LC7 domain-containing protein [Candidatus Thiothrix moscowensis]
MTPDTLGQKLSVFNTEVSGIEASAIISTTGVILSSALPTSVDEDKISAMSAALFTLGIRTLELAACGDFRHVVVTVNDHYLLLVPGGKQALVALWINGADYLDSAIQAADQFFPVQQS